MHIPNDSHGPAIIDGLACGDISEAWPTPSVQIAVYENTIPPFAESALERLYGAVYSSLSYFRTCDDLKGVSTYVVRINERISAVFLFRVENGIARVFNEGMHVGENDVRRCCDYLFSRYPNISAIAFRAVHFQGPVLPYCHQRFFFTEDFIAELPQSEEAYLARLGGATRKNLKRHRHRFERAFPAFQYQVYEKEAIAEQHVRTIIAMNRARMAQKNKVSFIDEEETRQILRLARLCGQLCVVTIEGEIAAGAVVFHVGDSFISKVNAHDSRYDDYRLGMLCCYLAVCAAIQRGGRRFHFGHGRYEYKTALLGEYQEYDNVVVYRSALHLLRHVRTAFSTARDGYRLKASRWLLEGAARGEGAGWNAVRRLLRAWRNIKAH